MVPINEYIDTLINARRYEIVEEKKLFGGLFDKKKKTVKNQTKKKIKMNYIHNLNIIMPLHC